MKTRSKAQEESEIEDRQNDDEHTSESEVDDKNSEKSDVDEAASNKSSSSSEGEEVSEEEDPPKKNQRARIASEDEEEEESSSQEDDENDGDYKAPGRRSTTKAKKLKALDKFKYSKSQPRVAAARSRGGSTKTRGRNTKQVPSTTRTLRARSKSVDYTEKDEDDPLLRETPVKKQASKKRSTKESSDSEESEESESSESGEESESGSDESESEESEEEEEAPKPKPRTERNRRGRGGRGGAALGRGKAAAKKDSESSDSESSQQSEQEAEDNDNTEEAEGTSHADIESEEELEEPEPIDIFEEPEENYFVTSIIACRKFIVDRDYAAEHMDRLRSRAKPIESNSQPISTSTEESQKQDISDADAPKTDQPLSTEASDTNEPNNEMKLEAPKPTESQGSQDYGELSANSSSTDSQLVSPSKMKLGTHDHTEVDEIVKEHHLFDEKAIEEDLAKEAGEASDQETELKYLVKFRDMSYIHCRWVSAEYIEAQQQGRTKLKRFMSTIEDEDITLYDPDEDIIDPEFVEVERIISEAVLKKTGNAPLKQYLIKWKGLEYKDCTWEDARIVRDKQLIKSFKRYRTPPTTNEQRIPPRPRPKDFQKMDESPSFKNNNKLREYQLEGFNWLVFCWYNRINSILADEMGLGKTVQTVSILEYLRTAQNIRGPFLIVAPLSTIAHWKREIEGWTDMYCVVFHGSQQSRNVIRSHEWNHVKKHRGRTYAMHDTFKFNVLITTYEVVLAESSTLSKINWQYLVVDEGHRLKNKSSKLLEHLQGFKAEHKLLLTGTPIQNSMDELFSLLHFLDAKNFSSEKAFMSKYGNPKDIEQVEELHKLIGPYLLRRLKEDVEKSIPPKEEIVVEVAPTSIQKTYYKAILNKNKEYLQRGVKSSNVPRLVNILMELRKVCNHPFLINGVEERLKNEMGEDESINEILIRSSSKLVLVDKLLKKLREDNHRVLIFSQMTRVLNILEDYLIYRRYPYERLDGNIRGSERQAAIDRFSKPDSDRFVFLLSTHAGGVGINLTAADTVIIYDSDWNPQNDLQAQARCHRIGQDKEVKVYRLLTKGTREKEMFERASLKLGLDRAVLTMNKELGDFEKYATTQRVKSTNKTGLANEDIETLLRHGAYSVYAGGDNEDERMLLEDDIDSILERTSTTVRYDAAKLDETGKSSLFAKASFVSYGVDDDDFWSKILPDSITPANLISRLNDGSAFVTAAGRRQFYEDLETLATEAMRILDKTQRYDRSADDMLIQLLEQVKQSESFAGFTEKEQRCISVWLRTLNRPRLRSGNDDDDDSDEESDDEHTDTANATSSAKSVKAVLEENLGWAKNEKVAMQRHLINFGYRQFENIELKRRTVAELVSFAECFVSKYRSISDSDTDKQFLSNLLYKYVENASFDLKAGLSKSVTGADIEKVDDLINKTSFKPVEKIVVRLGSRSDATVPLIVQLIQVAQLDDTPRTVLLRTIAVAPRSENKDGSNTFSIAAPGFEGKFIIRVASRTLPHAPEATAKPEDTTDADVVMVDADGKDAGADPAAANDEKSKTDDNEDEEKTTSKSTSKSKSKSRKRPSDTTSSSEQSLKNNVVKTGDDDLYFIAESSQFEVNGYHPILDDYQGERIVKNLRLWVKKMIMFDAFHQLVLRGIKDNLKLVPHVDVRLKMPGWWTIECDRDLILGIYKYGQAGLAKIRDDDEFVFVDTMAEAKKQLRQKGGKQKSKAVKNKPRTAADGEDDDGNDSEAPVNNKKRARVENGSDEENNESDETNDDDLWPTTSMINRRLARLSETFIQKEASKRHRLSLTRSPTSSSATGSSASFADDPMSPVKVNWSKKLKADFQRNLMKWGTCPDAEGKPQWRVLVKQFGIKNYPSETVSAYYDEFMVICEEMAKEERGESKPEDNEANEKSSKKAAKAKEKEREEREKQNALIVGDLTSKNAVKIIERIELMKRIAMFLKPNISDLASKVSQVRRTPQLPKWWKAKIHDPELFKAIEKHGLDFKAILADTTLKFEHLKKKEATGEKKVASSVGAAQPKERVLTQRLHDLCDLFDPEQNTKEASTSATESTSTSATATAVIISDSSASNTANVVIRKKKRTKQTSLVFKATPTKSNGDAEPQVEITVNADAETNADADTDSKEKARKKRRLVKSLDFSTSGEAATAVSSVPEILNADDSGESSDERKNAPSALITKEIRTKGTVSTKRIFASAASASSSNISVNTKQTTLNANSVKKTGNDDIDSDFEAKSVVVVASPAALKAPKGKRPREDAVVEEDEVEEISSASDSETSTEPAAKKLKSGGISPNTKSLLFKNPTT